MDIITQSVSFSVCRNNLTVERRQSFIDIDGKIEAAMVSILIRLCTYTYVPGEKISSRNIVPVMPMAVLENFTHCYCCRF